MIARRTYYCQEVSMTSRFRSLWTEEEGQDIAEYAVMLALILVIVVGTIRMVGTNANNVFSSVASSVQ
jgi:Flp pilus assembly pilin Flp